MKTLKDEIFEFVAWVFTDPSQQFYREAFAQTASSCLEVANEQFDHHHRMISFLGPAVCRDTVQQFVDMAKERCSTAPIPSDDALEALFSTNPKLSLERLAPTLTS